MAARRKQLNGLTIPNGRWRVVIFEITSSSSKCSDTRWPLPERIMDSGGYGRVPPRYFCSRQYLFADFADGGERTEQRPTAS
jgi:hypothetical protein